MPRFLIAFVIAALALAADQGSKWSLIGIALAGPGHEIAVTPFLNIVMVWNHGISFGMFAQHDQPLVLVAISCIIICILLIWMKKTPSMLVTCALASVIGGALGNSIDRLRLGAVADFFDFHIGVYHWPAFNIADSAIFIGVVLLCWHSMFTKPTNTP